ncbi:hypothetical protein SPI_02889 [Niveomyces insectorum RCEF 264]|uniref:Protein kinase-like domain protein n=1 Tax=Niveomyces insectorum RCEF 264 TaxID=1081102 RepID=A0A162J630_9HYPO|nr:hypothetical protein SPI_02889 [Niveomyces insectorum RCEF 264]
MSASATLVPYQPGVRLELEVLQNDPSLPLLPSVCATVTQMCSVTMSAVMKVQVVTPSGAAAGVVLKLYDRRFGTSMRKIAGKHVPHTAADEEQFCSFVRQGQMKPFLREFEEERTSNILGIGPEDMLDGRPDGRAKLEAVLWQECTEYFDNETEAYARLHDVQGRYVPRLYAHVRLVRRPGEAVPEDLLRQPDTAEYFDIKGVLLEPITGYELIDVATAPAAPADPDRVRALVQTAMERVHFINERGLLLYDCSPFNAIVEAATQQPFIVDFAQCGFKDKMIDQWENVCHMDEEEEVWDAEAQFREFVQQLDNVGAIGVVAANRYWREKGIRLQLYWPGSGELVQWSSRRD